MLKQVFIGMVLGTSLQMCAAEAQVDKIIPRSVLFAHPMKCAVKLNKAGNMVAYISRNEEKVEIHIADLNGKIIKKFTIEAARDMYNFCWSFNDKYLLVPQDKNGDENNHIICFDIKSGEKTDLTPYDASKSTIAAMSKNHPDEIIIACNKNDKMWFDIYKVNLVTQKTELLFKNREFSDFSFDNDMQLRYATKVISDGSLEIYKIENNQKKELFEKIAFEDSYNSNISHFNVDNKKLYFTSSKNRDTGALYEYDVETKTTKLLFETTKSEIESISCSPITYAPQIIKVGYLKSEPYSINNQMDSDIAFLKKADYEFSILGRSENDKIWMIAYANSTQSPKYYIYDREKRKLRFLFSARPDLDRYKLQPMEPVVVKSRDNLDLVCYLTRAKNSKKLVMYIHGGPWVRDSYGLNTSVQWLVNRGYSVLQVNYRGSVGFGKKFTNAICNNIRKVSYDIIDAANWAIENKIADKDKIAIMGGSFGGYATLAGLTYTPGFYCCGVDLVGPSNWQTLFDKVPAYWKPFMISWYKVCGDPDTQAGRESLKKISPLYSAYKIQKPLIIFQGKYDPRVNVNESEQIVQELQKNGIPVVYVLYSDEGHGFVKEPNKKSYAAITERFLANVLDGWYERIDNNEIKDSSYQILSGSSLLKIDEVVLK